MFEFSCECLGVAGSVDGTTGKEREVCVSVCIHAHLLTLCMGVKYV